MFSAVRLTVSACLKSDTDAVQAAAWGVYCERTPEGGRPHKGGGEWEALELHCHRHGRDRAWQRLDDTPWLRAIVPASSSLLAIDAAGHLWEAAPASALASLPPSIPSPPPCVDMGSMRDQTGAKKQHVAQGSAETKPRLRGSRSKAAMALLTKRCVH